MSDPDVIDMLAGLAPDSPLALIRDRKPVTRQNAQASYRALFQPADPADVYGRRSDLPWPPSLPACTRRTRLPHSTVPAYPEPLQLLPWSRRCRLKSNEAAPSVPTAPIQRVR